MGLFFLDGSMEERNQIVQQLRAAGLWTTADKSSKVWKRAFDLYNEATGTRLDMGCNKCFQKVKEWLEGKP